MDIHRPIQLDSRWKFLQPPYKLNSQSDSPIFSCVEEVKEGEGASNYNIERSIAAELSTRCSGTIWMLVRVRVYRHNFCCRTYVCMWLGSFKTRFTRRRIFYFSISKALWMRSNVKRKIAHRRSDTGTRCLGQTIQNQVQCFVGWSRQLHIYESKC